MIKIFSICQAKNLWSFWDFFLRFAQLAFIAGCYVRECDNLYPFPF